MRETTPAAMPPCFERWCSRFDDCFKTKAQTNGFRHYIGGLFGESERKNLTQMTNNAVGVTSNRIHHFLTEAQWSANQINHRRLEIMNKCSQTRIGQGFALIIDDSGHRKSGNFTDGVGRQYIGEIGKTDNGIVTVTTHLLNSFERIKLKLTQQKIGWVKTFVAKISSLEGERTFAIVIKADSWENATDID